MPMYKPEWSLLDEVAVGDMGVKTWSRCSRSSKECDIVIQCLSSRDMYRCKQSGRVAESLSRTGQEVEEEDPQSAGADQTPCRWVHT